MRKAAVWANLARESAVETGSGEPRAGPTDTVGQAAPLPSADVEIAAGPRGGVTADDPDRARARRSRRRRPAQSRVPARESEREGPGVERWRAVPDRVARDRAVPRRRFAVVSGRASRARRRAPLDVLVRAALLGRARCDHARADLEAHGRRGRRAGAGGGRARGGA